MMMVAASREENRLRAVFRSGIEAEGSMPPILGCYRVEQCVGYEEDPEGTWREPSWLVHAMDRDEAISFGRVFRQNTIVCNRNGRPELIITDPTCDELSRTFTGNWRVRG